MSAEARRESGGDLARARERGGGGRWIARRRFAAGVRLSTAVASGLALAASGAAAHASETAIVHAGAVLGRVPAIHGVNNGPLVRRAWNPLRPIWYDADYTTRFVEAEIPQSRTHGEGPMDMEKVWRPTRTVNGFAIPAYAGHAGEADDPASYDFAITDERVDANYAAGGNADVYVRLGHSAGANEVELDTPPDDAQVFADVSKHILMHYNDGWANGRSYGIRWVEVWNEPYLDEFWGGTPEQYAQLYATVYQTLKAYDPALMVGPSIVATSESGDFSDRFFDWIEAHGVPVDFLAPHYYRKTPWQIRKEIQAWTTFRGGVYAGVPIVVSEWNRTIPYYAADLDGQAFLMSVLSIMAKNHPSVSDYDLTMSHFFAARDKMWHASNAYKDPGLTWAVWHDFLYAPTPNLLAVEGEHFGTKLAGDDFTITAGSSDDGRALHAILTHYGRVEPDVAEVGAPFDLELRVDGLPWGDAPFTWRRYANDQECTLAACALREVESGIACATGGAWTYAASGSAGMKAQTYEVFTLEANDDTTGATPVRASKLELRDDSTPPAHPERRRVELKSARHAGSPSGVVAPPYGSAGDPTTVGSAGGGGVFTVYNACTGETARVDLPAANWRRTGKAEAPAYDYADPSHSAGPITKVRLPASGDLRVVGRGAAWPFTLDEPAQGRLAARLALGSDAGWCTEFPARATGNPPSTSAHDRVDHFSGARNGEPPATCPALP